MVKVFSDHGDVAGTRKEADDRAYEARMRPLDPGEGFLVGATGAIVMALDALRYEIRAGAQTISSAIGAAIEEWRGETRGER